MPSADTLERFYSLDSPFVPPLEGANVFDDLASIVEESRKEKDRNGNLYKGLMNQWNVAIGKAGRTRVLFLQGKAKSSDKRLRKTWAGRIAEGSVVATDGDRAYHLVVEDCRARK